MEAQVGVTENDSAFRKAEPAAKKSQKTSIDGLENDKDFDLTRDEWSNQWHSVQTSAKRGYLCQIKLKARLNLTPDQLFGIFSNPDNGHLFRDLGHTVRYEVKDDDGQGVQEVEIEQQALFKFLAIPFKFSTHLYVHLDYNKRHMSFMLARWGTMRKFEGEWNTEPIVENGKVVGTYATLDQNVLPLIVPPFLGGVLKGIAVNVLRRMIEDFEKIAERINKGEVLAELLGRSKWLQENEWLKNWRKEKEGEW